MSPAKSFRDLKVYQSAREGTQRVFELTKSFPREERYALTDQMRRSSRVVKAMIAEEVFADLDRHYNAIGGMLSRMIDRAADFCKYDPGTDYRSVARDENESPFTDH